MRTLYIIYIKNSVENLCDIITGYTSSDQVVDTIMVA